MSARLSLEVYLFIYYTGAIYANKFGDTCADKDISSTNTLQALF